MSFVTSRPTHIVSVFLASIAIAFTIAPIAHAAVDDEFNGPFASWRDLKRDYGAIGDGKADDTRAFQAGLDDLQKHEKAVVLYVPAGTYRIAQTLHTRREKHTDCMGVSLVGEDPATTSLLWDGPLHGTMLKWDAWYSRILRLTLDAADKADVTLQYGPSFSTYNQTSDITCKNAVTGLLLGGENYEGQAENEVLRCRFLHCDNGIMTAGWNSLDIWAWYCRFEDCGRGIHNVMGNWHCWQSLFLRSRVSDLSTDNLMAFSAANNTSVSSKCFFNFATGHSWGSPTSLTGNRVINPTGPWAAILSNAGPYLVVDNQFRLGNSTRAIQMTWGDQTLAGNSYSKPDAVEEHGRFRRLDEHVVDAGQISDAIPELPPTPAHQLRPTIEVAAGASAEAIQAAINQAAKLNGKRPVVHLPMGVYKISGTLAIPADCDVQLIGDGAGETATRLEWAGKDDGVVLRLQGPCRATLRDFYINSGQARAIEADHVDQPGGRIFADQLNVSGPSAKGSGHTSALRIAGLTQSDALFEALQGSGNSGKWVEVAGNPNVANATNQISVFTGATGSAAGQYDVRDNGRLVVRGVYHEKSSNSLSGLRLTGSGTLSIDATRFSYATSPAAPTISAENFGGLFTLATCMLLPVDTKDTCRFEIKGDGSKASVLALNDQFWVQLPGTTAATVWQNEAQPPAHGGLVGCNINTSNKEAAPKGFAFLPNIGDDPDPAKSRLGSGPLDDQGHVDDATLLRHLEPLRRAKVWLPETGTPAGATDLRFYRVMASGGSDAVVELRR